MPQPKYQIPDQLQVNNLVSSGSNSLAYFKICEFTHAGVNGETWFFPLPNNVSYQTGYDWTTESLGQFVGDSIENISKAIKGDKTMSGMSTFDSILSILGKGLKETAMGKVSNMKVGNVSGSTILNAGFREMGVAYNPNEQLFFQGMKLRDFEFEFPFAPTSTKEANYIRSGVRKLILAASPEYAEKQFYFTYPSKFSISIFIENYKLFELQQLRITSINCNMNPDGVLTWHEDYFPTSISLSVGFKESIIATKDVFKSNISIL